MNLTNASEIVTEIINGNRVALARAMTLIESTSSKHQSIASDILDQIMPLTGRAKRIGITGVPGAGKSTLLEALGMHLIKQGLKVGIIAIDPSSSLSGGSILGDKTRMVTLLREEQAFIRPVPSGGHLGGISKRTRELTFLLEAAGYDVVIVETVGVGQSEIAVSHMVDFFCLVQIAGAGDELQGIKKGIMEVTDTIIINKDDGDNRVKVEMTKSIYKSAFHIMKPKYESWQTKVLSCSAIEKRGIAELWGVMEHFFFIMNQNGQLEKTRNAQYLNWVQEQIEENFLKTLYTLAPLKEKYEALTQCVKAQTISPRRAVLEMQEKLEEILK